MNIETKVLYINKYNNFRDLLNKETIQKVLPNMTNIENGVEIYHKYYTSEDENKYNVLAIGLETIKTHDLTLDDIYYNYISNGEKVYELRINDDKRKNMKESDYVNFYNRMNKDDKIIKTKIIQRKEYKSFLEAITDIGYKQLMPQTNSIDEAVNIYEKIDNGNYFKEAQLKGVVVFKIELSTL